MVDENLLTVFVCIGTEIDVVTLSAGVDEVVTEDAPSDVLIGTGD